MLPTLFSPCRAAAQFNEVLQWTRVNGDPAVANIAIIRVAGSGPSVLKFVLFNALSIDEWHTHSGTIFGQAASANAVAVGAVPFYAPTNIEPFSSRGNVTNYFDSQGNRLPTRHSLAPTSLKMMTLGRISPELPPRLRMSPQSRR
jgi:hypothetical protein